MYERFSQGRCRKKESASAFSKIETGFNDEQGNALSQSKLRVAVEGPKTRPFSTKNSSLFRIQKKLTLPLLFLRYISDFQEYRVHFLMLGQSTLSSLWLQRLKAYFLARDAESSESSIMLAP
jgi:hypothetical protein